MIDIADIVEHFDASKKAAPAHWTRVVVVVGYPMIKTRRMKYMHAGRSRNPPLQRHHADTAISKVRDA